jgi:hypothetical protein
MPTIGFQSFLTYGNWVITGGSIATNPPNGVNITANAGSTANYTYPSNQLLYSGTLTFNYNVTTAGAIGTASILINGSETLLSTPSGTYGPTAISANSQIILRYNNVNDESKSVTLQITNFQFEYQDQIPCFNEGSKILCLKDNEEVYVPIESIKKEDLVKTYKHGYKKVEIIGNKKIYNFKYSKIENNIYKLSKEKYSELNEDLYLTGFHSILVDNISEEQIQKTKEILKDIYITDDKYRLLTCIDSRSERIEEEKEYTIYHFALENDDYYMNYGVYANGLLVESSSLRYMKELSGMNC